MENSAQKFAFGIYEVDARTGELRKAGFKLRVQEQPFQILLMLLDRPGDVVTREELRLRLWPADTFVDFDHGLNTAINKLREVLGDRASNPRFIETLPKRGYRFIAPVRVIEAPAPVPATVETAVAVQPLSISPDGLGDTIALTQEEQGSVVAASVPVSAPPSVPATDLPQPSRWVPRLLFALAQLMYLIFYGVALIRLDFIPDIAEPFLGRFTSVLVPLVIVTASVGIALRLYLLTAVIFDYRPLGSKFRRLFPAVLPLDQLWALAPFLLIPQIGVGGAFAACAALLYLPFSERTLIRMSYRYQSR